MLKSFAEYLKEEKEPVLEETEDLTEAVVPEMKKFFSSKEIQDIGRKLSSLNISMQNSEIQAWGPKGFRLKHAKAHKLHFVKIWGTPGYVMLYYVNARSADIVHNTTGIEFSDFKDVYKNAQQVFSFNTVTDISNLLSKRFDNLVASRSEDPLLRNQRTRDDRLYQLKRQKMRSNYSYAVMNNLKEYFGIVMTGLRGENGTCRFEKAEFKKKFKHIIPTIIQVGLKGQPALKIALKERSVTGNTELNELINELQDLTRTAQALENLDIKKLNQE